MRASRFRRFLLVCTGILIALGVLAEGLGLLRFSAKNGGIFYFRQAVSPPDVVNPAIRNVLHPYFGYGKARAPGHERDDGMVLNNHGFFFDAGYYTPGCCDYPTARESNVIVVGIFGGSVASGLAVNIQRKAELLALLERLPRFKGKTLRVLSFASPGYKQPQQLLILAYYLSIGQPIDVILNLDGFTDVSLALANARQGVEPSYPNPGQWLRLAKYLDGLATAPRDPANLLAAYHSVAASAWGTRADECALASCYLYASAMQGFHRYFADMGPKKEDMSLFQVFPAPDLDQGAMLSLIADRWAESSREMQYLARAHGALYLHVLHPNQWFRRTDRYQARQPEKLDPQLPEDAEKGYRLLVERAAKLKMEGVNIFDATAILDDAPAAQFYNDDCCHLSPAGEERLVKAMAENLNSRAP